MINQIDNIRKGYKQINNLESNIKEDLLRKYLVGAIGGSCVDTFVCVITTQLL